MAFVDDKNDFLQMANRLKCGDVGPASDMLTGYAAIPYAVMVYSGKLSCKPLILTQYLSNVTNDADLTSNDVHLNKSGTINNPLVVVGGTIDKIVIDTTVVGTVLVFGAEVTEIEIQNAQVGMLLIAGGAKVQKIVKTHANAAISNLKISSCDSYISAVYMVQEPAWVVNVITTGGGYFGGVQCEDIVTTPCGNEVTSLAVDNITGNSMRLTWTAGVTTMGTEVFYRVYNEADWKKTIENSADGVTGTYIIDDANKYIFKGLQPDTYYEFKVVNICPDGLKSVGSKTSQKTTS